MLSLPERRALDHAVEVAQAFVGNTAPNPPVGAVAIDANGNILAACAHERAGTAHAEAALLARLRTANLLDQVVSLIVTLEPCNHQGRTPPCTTAIAEAWPAQKRPDIRIIYGERDPNPFVHGGGAQTLTQMGFSVDAHSTAETRELLAPFAKTCRSPHPWITIKTAEREIAPGQFTLIPPPGKTTFMSDPMIRLAHQLRKQSDAIVVSSATWIADHPKLTVRAVPDFPGRKRLLWVLDRNDRLTDDEITQAANLRGMMGVRDCLPDLSQSFELMKTYGVLKALIEPGPRLLKSLREGGLWDEHVVLTQDIGSRETVNRILAQP